MENENFLVGQERRLPCSECDSTTNHSIQSSIMEYWDDPGIVTYYQIVKCKGCDNVSFRLLRFNDSDDAFYEYRELGTDIEVEWTGVLFPTGFDSDPDYKRDSFSEKIAPYVSSDLVKICIETQLALSNDMLILAGVGIRAILDFICKDKRVTGRNLHSKIESLESTGFISRVNKDVLVKIKDIGNRSAHDSFSATAEQLSLAFDIVKALIVNLYVHVVKGGNTL